MCGITGFFSFNDAIDPAILNSMAAAIRHRGPDDSGLWHDAESGIGLAHRRLSILDLSPAGHQPMSSASGRFVIVFNGEIYNHLEIREELEKSFHKVAWNGHSDTETVLAGFDAWGVERTLQRAIGMFAIAVWDKAEKTLILFRDRLGEKPLYYGWVGRTFGFASELKVLRALPGFTNPINRAALALFMRHNAVPAPHSIYEKIYKLRPGHWLTIAQDDIRRHRLPESKAYWCLLDVAQTGVAQPSQFVNDANAVDALEKVLMKSVRGQMLADVPLGAFLSGGIDSSLVVALMQAQSSLPVQSFSIGFFEDAYNEAQHAKAVARHLGTDHTELYVTDHDALTVIPKLPTIYCEPFSDSSQIPTFLLSQMTRQRVTVALSGDAGDELFGGYNRYFIAMRLWRKLSLIPRFLRMGMGMAIRVVPIEIWNSLSPFISPFLPTSKRAGIVGDKLHKGAVLLQAGYGSTLYRNGFISHWDPDGLVLDTEEPSTPLTESWPVLPTFIEQMMALDAITYLPDDILVKVDRAAMAVSLEIRVPFLDHRVVEFAWRLPLHYKVRHGVGKWILREVLYKYVPRKLIERPKMGFGVPIDSWLRGPLREWAEALLAEDRLKREGFFNPAPIRKKWAEHLSGQRNWQYHLWDVLMFQSWLAEQG